MSDKFFGEGLIHQRLRKSSRLFFWLGLAMVVVGVAAVVFPAVSTFAATILVGWVFLFSGGLTFFGSFSIHGTGPFFGALLLGLLSIAAGVFMLFNPLAGAAALTIVVGVLFLLESAFEIFFAFELRPQGGWISMLLSGIASGVIAVLIAAGWPTISVIVLGILLGVNFISTGCAYLVVSHVLKPAP